MSSISSALHDFLGESLEVESDSREADRDSRFMDVPKVPELVPSAKDQQQFGMLILGYIGSGLISSARGAIRLLKDRMSVDRYLWDHRFHTDEPTMKKEYIAKWEEHRGEKDGLKLPLSSDLQKMDFTSLRDSIMKQVGDEKFLSSLPEDKLTSVNKDISASMDVIKDGMKNQRELGSYCDLEQESKLTVQKHVADRRVKKSTRRAVERNTAYFGIDAELPFQDLMGDFAEKLLSKASKGLMHREKVDLMRILGEIRSAPEQAKGLVSKEQLEQMEAGYERFLSPLEQALERARKVKATVQTQPITSRASTSAREVSPITSSDEARDGVPPSSTEENEVLPPPVSQAFISNRCDVWKGEESGVLTIKPQGKEKEKEKEKEKVVLYTVSEEKLKAAFSNNSSRGELLTRLSAAGKGEYVCSLHGINGKRVGKTIDTIDRVRMVISQDRLPSGRSH